MKLGIMGGSFNPVHLGHLFLADIAISELKLDRVVMIPAYHSPFKTASRNTDDRLEMLAAAISGDSRLTIDDCEFRREGVSYTVDTLEDIIARYLPVGKPSLIIGDDLAADFTKWRNSKKILRLADVVIGRRIKDVNCHDQYPYPCKLLNNDVINISSQIIRQRIRESGVWRSLVPAEVRVIIEDKKLYGLDTDMFMENIYPEFPDRISLKIIQQIEIAVRETISIKRFIHSRNTALLAADLCRRFGVDPADGYLAGVVHDLGKELDSKQMAMLAKTDGKPITELEKEKPGLLHGRAGAVLLKERFCIHNKNILEAVRLHTSGSEDMGILAKIVYIADKAECSRNIDTELRRICNEDQNLDNILFAVLKRTVSKLQSRKLNLSEGTLRLLNRMNERKL